MIFFDLQRVTRLRIASSCLMNAWSFQHVASVRLTSCSIMALCNVLHVVSSSLASPQSVAGLCPISPQRVPGPLLISTLALALLNLQRGAILRLTCFCHMIIGACSVEPAFVRPVLALQPSSICSTLPTCVWPVFVTRFFEACSVPSRFMSKQCLLNDPLERGACCQFVSDQSLRFILLALRHPSVASTSDDRHSPHIWKAVSGRFFSAESSNNITECQFNMNAYF